jgi:hypothetical protein
MYTSSSVALLQKPKREPKRKSLFARIKSAEPITLTIWVVGAGLVVGAKVFILFWPSNFIIVTFDDQGKVTLLAQLDQNDYENLPITWEAVIPLETNRSLIYPVTSNAGRNFDFYKYMKEQYLSH